MRITLLLVSSILSLHVFADQLVLPDTELVSEETMDSSRGGQYLIDIDSVSATSTISGVSKDNTAMFNHTGDNVISSGALNGVSGITSVIQNTGNNVLIQDSTVVNLTLR